MYLIHLYSGTSSELAPFYVGIFKPKTGCSSQNMYQSGLVKKFGQQSFFAFFLTPQHLSDFWQISPPLAIKCHCELKGYYLYPALDFYFLVFLLLHFNKLNQPLQLVMRNTSALPIKYSQRSGAASLLCNLGLDPIWVSVW